MEREIRIPKQKRSIEKKNRIVLAAYKLFNEKGFHNINTAQIAKEAGLSTGCLYDYFIDKQDIFMEVLKMHNQEITEFIHKKLNAIPTEATIFELMKQMINIFLESHDHSKGFHQEVMALSYSNNSISNLLSSYEKEEIIQDFINYLSIHNVPLTSGTEKEKILLMLNTLDNISHELLFKEHLLIDTNAYINECAHMLESLFVH